jgi:ankyrin repeat protein
MPSKAKQRAAELALHHAIGICDIAEVRALLKQNVDPNCVGQRFQKFPYAFTALCAAIQMAAKAVSITRAARNAALDEAAKELGLTRMADPLDKASARTDGLQIIQLLLSSGADPNRRGASRTPLSLAAGHYGDIELTRLLLDAGAHPDSAGWSLDGRKIYCTAILEAAGKGFTDVVALLCEKGADTKVRDWLDHETPSQVARRRGHPETVRFLEQYGEP